MHDAQAIINTCTSLVSPLNNVAGTHRIENQIRREESAQYNRMDRFMQKKSKLVSQLTSYEFHLPKAKDDKGISILSSTVPLRYPDPTISNNHPSIPSILHTTLLGVGIEELRDQDGKPCLPRPPDSASMFTPKQAVSIIVDRETALELGRHTTERFNYHLSNRINNKDKHHHGAINFIKENLHVCDAITTLAGHVKTNLSSIRSGASLLRGPTCQAFQTVDEDDNGTLMGAYLHHNPISMEDSIRSASAANGDGQRTFACRNREHRKGSMNSTLDDIKSRFYIRYPSKVGGHNDKDLRWGHFDDLSHYVALGFSLSNGVNNLLKEKDGVFVWSDRTLNVLKGTKMGGATMRSKNWF